jgi:predicted outer membrane repeat protein
MYCYYSSPTLTDCTFSENQGALTGGGVSCYGSSPTFAGCTFSGNTSDQGGGVYCFYSSATFTDCTFAGNLAESSGGGVHCERYSSPTLTGCTFLQNQANFLGGGGLYCYNSFPTLTRCTFSGNKTFIVGGGILSTCSSSPTLFRSIIAFSQAGGAVYCEEGSHAVLSCCDVFGNTGGDWTGRIADQYGVDGNFSEDPRFCDAPNGDLTLASDSTCLPDGNECGVLVGAHDQGCEAD